MRYQEVIPAVFLERPNRFIALVLVNGQTERVHVKNTGRCRELLIAGCTVYLAAGKNPSRKTKYDLIARGKGAAGFHGIADQHRCTGSQRRGGGMAAHRGTLSSGS